MRADAIIDIDIDIDKLVVQLENCSNKEESYAFLHKILLLHFSQPHAEYSLNYAFRSLKIAQDLNDPIKIANSQSSVASSYLRNSQLKPAQEHNLLAKEVIDQLIKSSDNQSAFLSETFIQIYLIQGLIELKMGNYSKALEHNLHIFKYIPSDTDDFDLASLYNNLAIIFFKTDQLSKSLAHHEKSIYYKKKHKNRYHMSSSYGNIGLIYSEQKLYKKALDSHQKAAELQKEFNDKKGYAYSLNNIGECHLYLNKYPLAIQFFKKSIRIKKTINDQPSILRSLNNIAKAYYIQNKFEQAISISKEALELEKNNHNLFLKKSTTQTLADCYEAKNDFKKATFHLREVVAIQNQIAEKNKTDIVAKLSIRYEVTQKEKDNEALRKLNETISYNNQFLNTLINTIPCPFYYTNPEGLILGSNKAFENYIDKKDQDIKNKSINEFLPLEIQKEHSDVDQEVLSKGMLKQYESKFPYKDGSLRTVLLSKKTYLNGDQSIGGLIAIVLDIDYLKKMEQKLRNSNQALSQFAFAASHDLREPLRMINRFSSLLRRSSADKLDKEGIEYLNFITSSATRMAQLIEDLLNYASLNKNIGEPKLVDLNTLVQNIIRDISLRVKESQANIICHDLPKIIANKSLIRQLFQNLISNGIKFRKKDSIAEISIRFKQDEHNIHFSIKDNGIGISPKHHDSIFEIFSRLNSKKKYDGSGIGLASCKKIIEFYAGQISIDSEPKQGSTFHISLPKKVLSTNLEIDS